MIPLFLIIAVVFNLTYFAALPVPIKIVCYVALAIALVLLVEPLALRHAPLW